MTNVVVGLKTPPSVVWYHHDQLGSTRLLTVGPGSVAATYTFDPHGNLVTSTNPESVSNPLQYAGQYLDSESVFYYLRARYYDPSTGQFISKDPMMAQTREAYAYVQDNPLTGTDPLGLFGWNDVVTFAKAAVTAPIAATHSLILFTESVISTAFYATYWGAYQVNARWSGEPAPLRQFMSAVQRLGLKTDKAFDVFQERTGYPGATLCDEEQRVSPLPSVIYPTWDKDHWKQNKWSEPWVTTQWRGVDPNGKEHYAD